MSTIAFEEFWQRFVALERKHKLLSLRIGGLQVYALLRTRLFYAVAQELGIFEHPHPNAEKNETDASLAEITTLENLTKSPNVIVPFKRRVAGLDPYSERVREGIRGSVRVIDFTPSIDAQDPGSTDEVDLERLKAYFTKTHEEMAKRLMRRLGPKDAEARYAAMIDALEGEFGIKLEAFRKYPKWRIRRDLTHVLGFRQLFRQLKTRRLYIVNAYSEPTIVIGAKLAGVWVSEIQHGFISPFHPAYSFPAGFMRPWLDAAPHRILTWGKYWAKDTRLPLCTRRKVTGPTRSFADYRDAVLAGHKKPIEGQILFTSQGVIGAELFKAAHETAVMMPNNKVIFRLHPNEAVADYQALAKQLATETGQAPANLEISHRDPIFLDLVSASEFLVGAFSTTLFEGLALGCKVVVLPLPGFENIRAAIDSGDITLVSNLKELPDALKRAKPATDKYRYYAKTK